MPLIANQQIVQNYTLTQIGDVIEGLEDVNVLQLTAEFTYASGGATALAVVQTSLDEGATWWSIATFKFLVATAQKRLIVVPGLGLAAAGTLTAAALADDTAINLLGDRIRALLTTTDDYVGSAIKLGYFPKY